jgi:hypothetical protein
VHFVDAKTGWAVGDGATIIAYSGTQWGGQYPPTGSAITANLRAVHFTDALHGCAVGDGGTILWTDTGGRGWHDGKSGVTRNLRAVAFVDASHGWAVGDRGTMIVTADGGKTWNPQTLPAEVTATLRGISFGSRKHAAAVGDGGTALFTYDGGNTWTPVQAGGLGLAITPGRFYVDGILCENDRPLRVTEQPELPGANEPGRFKQGNEFVRYVVYLDVWERHLTALERPDIREVALGGPDTATRTKIVAQVKWQELSTAVDLDAEPPWVPSGVSNGFMAARAAPAVIAENICLVPPGGGYRRLENQLYRVEVHDAADGQTLLKWSRDNGSVLARLDRVDDDRLAISAPGPDAVAAFDGAPWVEVTDDERTLTTGHGDLVQLTSAQGGKLIPVDSTALGTLGSNPVVRRWDGVCMMEEGWMDLEDGVQICFESTQATFCSGDYWLVPARSLTATVEWPLDEKGPMFQPAHGIVHHYALLADLRTTESYEWNIIDRRHRFAAITKLSVGHAADPAVHVTSVSVRSRLGDSPIRNGGQVLLDDVKQGIAIAFDRRVERISLRSACRVTIDVPFPLSRGELADWDEKGPVGVQPLVLESLVVADDESNSISLQAPGQAWAFVGKVLDRLFQSQQLVRVRAHLELEGNFIWAADNRSMWLDGDTFGTTWDLGHPEADLVQTGGHIGGDGRRGGDFRMWFSIVPQTTSATGGL